MIKLNPNKPSPTILKSCGNPVCHYDEPRFLDTIELKRVASFPDNFKFIGKISQVRDRIGNAVMPKFMYHIAKHIKENILYVANNKTGIFSEVPETGTRLK